MKAYVPYISHLRELLFDRREEQDFPELAERALNGEASARLVELVSPYGLKRTGAFFSSTELSERAAVCVPRISAAGPLVADPACGAGNLLLAAAKKLPVKPSLSATLHLWGAQLAGFDVHREFISAVHHRLAVLAVSRGAHFDIKATTSLAGFFPHIRCGDGMREISNVNGITHLLINPPFGMIKTPDRCQWADGKVTKAAVFFERCLTKLHRGTRVSAILPDVLRAGSRYQRWRETIENLASVERITPMGNFRTANIDVFLLDAVVGGAARDSRREGRWWTDVAAADTVGHHFDVHVGAVVPHRLKKNEGPIYLFLHAKGLPFWGTYKPRAEVVAFGGNAVRPPFVAVRRTSSPSDHSRALATIISGTRPVAVENHLIVCSPKCGELSECERLLDVLQRPATNDFLNRRIRCRHLTVGVVKEIPW